MIEKMEQRRFGDKEDDWKIWIRSNENPGN